ncbi:MAG: nucleotidyltransferase domain-containing protein [Anaerolineaceae bacterium]|nr:nucleotidyltransferase domain-containing protein [Anaerolineaceae bacterium]MCB9099360.1 nucleotidyltransferase domain-containing protein [Anaerolineales bacterium]
MSKNDGSGLPNEAQIVPDVRPPGFAPVTKALLNKIVQQIVEGVQPDKIILFGSYGYGSPTNDSDVDLLVIMDTDDRPAERYLAISRLIRPRPFPLDILVKTPAEITQALKTGDFFIREIMMKGQSLYERSG